MEEGRERHRRLGIVQRTNRPAPGLLLTVKRSLPFAISFQLDAMSSSSGSSYTSSPLLEPVPLPGPPAGGGVLHSRPNSSSPPSSNKRPRLGDRVRSRSSQSEGSDHEEEEHYQNGTHQPQQPLSHQPHPVLRPNDADVGAQEEVQWGLEPTFFGIEPLDEFTTKVGDWLWDHSKGRANVEVRPAPCLFFHPARSR
jgi:hypothetical protein